MRKVPDSWNGEPIQGSLDRFIEKNLPTQPVFTGAIDLFPALGGKRSYERTPVAKKKLEKGWVDLYNAQEGEFKGKRRINVPDIYRAIKEGSEELLKSLRNDFDDTWIMTGTKLLYAPYNLSAKVVHNYGSTIVKPVEIPLEAILAYDGPITGALVGNGVEFAQAIFGTNDDAATIIANLEKLTQKSADKIMLSTPTQSQRRSSPEKFVGLTCPRYGQGFFYVRGDGRIIGNGSGKCRGVSLK